MDSIAASTRLWCIALMGFSPFFDAFLLFAMVAGRCWNTFEE